MVQSLSAFLETRLEDEVVSLISGNAPREIKEIPIKWLAVFRHRKVSFASLIADRVRVVEVSIVENPEDPVKIDGRVVCEIDVTSGSRQASLYTLIVNDPKRQTCSMLQALCMKDVPCS